MKKYLFYRVLRSLLSIFLVTTLTYIMIYSLVPRRDIFKADPMISKLSTSPDQLVDYKNTAYDKMNYIDYLDTKSLINQVSRPGHTVTAAHTAINTERLRQWTSQHHYTLHRYPQSGSYYATRELPLWQRVTKFYAGLIQIDTPWAVHDPANPKLPRYLKVSHDPIVGWALIGSGTRYKYQLYVNSAFPYLHENFIHLNLGISYPTYAGTRVTEVIGSHQGEAVTHQYKFANGQKLFSTDDVYTRQYQPVKRQDPALKAQYGDNYTAVSQQHQDPSMIGTSFKAGLGALLIAYVVAIPMAILMARYKGQWFDKLGTGIVTALIAVPSLAFIYAFRYLGSAVFNLPDSFPTSGAGALASWVSPTLILGLLSVSGLVIWFRRYMIDQQSADYVKFAKVKGLTDNEIYRKHIFKNASLPIVQGLPGSIIGLIGGATMTETIFAMPGMGKMLPDAILAHNNPIVIGLVFIFTTIAVFSILLGDILMTIVDPRIKLTTTGDD
ncbi:peptide ABC transporter permease [Lactiplantibacillus plantarum EGD-AQ4]|nr:peptide ABC transporter permease [Lactiplantibacillus plantarum EGD-AQ4]